GIIPYLDDSSSELITRFTFGTGTTNHEREGYFVGWELVNLLLEEGITLEEIAAIKEEDMPDYIKEVYPRLLS
ncbi:hypothetical protein, partial [Jeotgalibacillus sp. R-1-5s-1]|uniref:hypothetical protein n=1 Tax=Jeotgalibacillus sp. R-1-5s-1 TaxID=2555897 RepID=UPI00141A7E1F